MRRDLPARFSLLGGAAFAVAGTVLILGLALDLPRLLEIPGIHEDAGYSNWLILILAIHAGSPGAESAGLAAINPWDVGLMLLFGAGCLGSRFAQGRRSRLLTAAAAALPLAGLLVYGLTGLAGRCAIMLAVIFVSVALLRGGAPIERLTASLGLLGGLSLFIGDFTVGVEAPAITGGIAVGYLALSAFCLCMAFSLVKGPSGGEQAGAPRDR